MSPRPAKDFTNEYVLLALLDKKPAHGYELYHHLAAMKGISLVWNVNQASLYAILEKLERREFLSSQPVQGETYPPRKYYYLTETGRSALHTWMTKPVRKAREFRQEFLIKLMVVLQYGKDRALELIENQEKTCLIWQQDLVENPPPHTQAQMDEWVVYSFRLNRVKSLLTWLDACKQDIREVS